MSLNLKTSTDDPAGKPTYSYTCNTHFYLADKVLIVEERNSKGEIIKKYSKGRFLGKVIIASTKAASNIPYIGRFCQML